MNTPLLAEPAYRAGSDPSGGEENARMTLGSIERAARQLLLPTLESGDFDSITDDVGSRTQLRSIAAEVAAVEGYVRLRGIEFGLCSRFVRGIDLFLRDQFGEALRTLRDAAHDRALGDLQPLALYWVGRLNNDIGRYRQATHLFRTVQQHVKGDSIASLGLDVLVTQANFFERAAAVDLAAPAQARLDSVAHLLDRLQDLTQRLYEHRHDAKAYVSDRLVRLSGDIFTWIAYDPRRLVDRIDSAAISRAASAHDSHTAVPWKSAPLKGLDQESSRAWALLHARAIYHSHGDSRDLSLMFAEAECDYALGVESVDLAAAIDRMLIGEPIGPARPAREIVDLEHVRFVTGVRTLAHRRHRGLESDSAFAEVRFAYRRVLDALSHVGDYAVTIFSRLQRRNLTHVEFADEERAMMDQALAIPEPDS